MTGPAPSEAAQAILDTLGRYRYSGLNERTYQESIERVLTDAGVSFTREAALSPRDRIDFLCADGVGIEVKVQGPRAGMVRQLGRYVRSPQISEIILASTSRRLLFGAPDSLLDIPIYPCYLTGGHL